ncbi:protein of unknown function [Streptantibioticus cattleyicolor NRRL 8057 = DSM 46488]|nr:protein of unknown function [Streptantibioticus cattleyicolor NRRL 8057 = DSM 46488]
MSQHQPLPITAEPVVDRCGCGRGCTGERLRDDDKPGRLSS